MAEHTTVAQAFQATAAAHPERVALRTKGDEFSITWREYADRVTDTAGGLAALGLERGQAMGILLTNRPEFHWFDAAALHLGATPFSLYNTYTREQIEYQLTDARARILVTEQAFAERVEGLRVHRAPDRRRGPRAPGRARRLRLRRARGRRSSPTTFSRSSTRAAPPARRRASRSRTPTWWPPSRASTEIIEFPDDGRLVSWLPMAHIAERNCTQYLPMFVGLLDHLLSGPAPGRGVPARGAARRGSSPSRASGRSSRPPSRRGSRPSRTRRSSRPPRWALDLGLRKARGEEMDPEEHAKADELVLSKIRAMLGFDQLEAVNVGAAPTPPEVIEFFHALGIPLSELWGMSETTGYGAVNPPDAIKIGTVGPPAPGAEIKLADDGEVLIRGPFITTGYRNMPGPDERGDRRRRLASHRRHRRVRRRRLPPARRPQEGADHQRGRQEHVARRTSRRS